MHLQLVDVIQRNDKVILVFHDAEQNQFLFEHNKKLNIPLANKLIENYHFSISNPSNWNMIGQEFVIVYDVKYSGRLAHNKSEIKFIPIIDLIHVVN